MPRDTQAATAGGPLPGDQRGGDTQSTVVAGERPLIPADLAAADALLLVLADALDDCERVRIATGNRLRALKDDKRLDGTPAAAALEALHGQLAGMEHALALDLKRGMRRHPLGPWAAGIAGVGEKQAARLLAAIGDPAARPNPAKLVAYCGLHVIAGRRPKRQKGEKANWSNAGKMRARLIAQSITKQRCPNCTAAARARQEADDGAGWAPPPPDCICASDPKWRFRVVYDRERLRWLDRDVTDKHRDNHALGVVAKQVLIDLWRASRETAA